MVSTFFLCSASAATVDVSINFEDDTTYFSYIFNFDENERYNSFSFEKPRDAILISALDDKNTFIRTSVAGDYFIIYPELTGNSSIIIDFESKTSYINVLENNIFSSYFTFNFDVVELMILFDYSLLNKTLLSVNPRDYTISERDNLDFLIRNLEGETFLQIEFISDDIDGIGITTSYFEKYFYIVLSLLLLIVIFAVFFLRGYLKNIKNKQKNKPASSEVILDSSEGEVSESIDVTLTSGSHEKEQNSTDMKHAVSITQTKQDLKNEFDEYMAKYLTENEKEVVLIVKEFTGIPQNEILHHLPSLTKSNLSKIITKLHGKRVLSRIRVGKINKIYLGDTLKFSETPEDENK
jgi:hypothetical protein